TDAGRAAGAGALADRDGDGDPRGDAEREVVPAVGAGTTSRSASPRGSPGLNGALRSIFEEPGRPEDSAAHAPRRPASELIRRLARDLPADVYRWTGHFPERTRLLLRHLAERADVLGQVYAEDRETPAVIALTTFVTALAMNYVYRGSYMP